jgi:hypothetical protein
MEDERSLKRNRQVMRTTGIVPALHDTPLVVKLDDGRRTVAPRTGRDRRRAHGPGLGRLASVRH